jgi:hypothetical protein
MTRLWILLGFLVVLLVPSAQAALLYSQNFDSMTPGSIVGQDSFTNVINGNNWLVGTFPVFEGAQSSNCTSALATRTVGRVVPYTPEGSLVLWVYMSGVASEFQFLVLNSTNLIYDAHFQEDYDLAYANNAAFPVIGKYSNDTYMRIDMKWDNTSGYNICVNQTNCFTAINRNAAVGTPSQFRFDSPNLGSPSGFVAVDSLFMFDTFEPDENLMSINLVSPLNTSYNVSSVEINATFRSLKNVSYSIDTGANISAQNNTQTLETFVRFLDNSPHNLTMTVVDSTTGLTDMRTVYFSTNATGEARFTNDATGALVTEEVVFSIFNFTARTTVTTETGTARFNWTDMPTGSIQIEANTTGGNFINLTTPQTIGLFESFNQSFTLEFGGTFNVSVFDEIKKAPFNFTIVNSTLQSMTLKVFCPNEEFEFNITSPTPGDNNVSVSCGVTEVRMISEFSDETVRPFRSLRPTNISAGVRFWMVENITEDLIYQQFFTISDLVGTFKEGQLEILKLINSSLETIHQVTIGADGSAFAYLIDSERYQIRIVSADGRQIKTIGDFNALESQGSGVVLEATTLEYNPAFSFLFNDVGWTFSTIDGTDTLALRYVDAGQETTSITYTVWNASNVSEIIFNTTSTASVKIYDFTYTVSDRNASYLVGFTATNAAHGIIERSVIQDFSEIKMTLRGVDSTWYMVFGMFLIIITALLFGAKFNEIAGVAVSLEAGMFWYWGWFGTSISLMIILIGIALSVLNMMRRGERT